MQKQAQWLSERKKKYDGIDKSKTCKVNEFTISGTSWKNESRWTARKRKLKSGQKLNFQKSQVLFSNNISVDLASYLSRDLEIQNSNYQKDLGLYLGAPMLH
ncbi:hypothetical protein MTR_2g089805 [Medicago truncatula]|uniref:Uncharacterized protein n=1 Tax=Medicago truncatula TaxID=3880 RepID=A0A072VAH3_MEDTR|nr:hypothetical protein MTR_2g089805 [Medicago truncatula]